MNKLKPFNALLISFFILLSQHVNALGTTDLLPADQAFKVSAQALSAKQLEISLFIAKE